MDIITSPVRPALPSLLSPASVWVALRAGALGLLIWEVFARGLAPCWLGQALEPTALISMAFGIEGIAAQATHLFSGVLAFPLGYMLLRWAAQQIAPGLPAWLLGLAYGTALWVFAMYVVARLIGGMPGFLGFSAIAWASLVGHLLMATGFAVAADKLSPREAA